MIFHIFVTLAMIGVIFMQKGEEVSAGSGGNSYNQVFSGRGSKNILTRITGGLATVFFLNCIFLGILVRQDAKLSESKPAESTTLAPTVEQRKSKL